MITHSFFGLLFLLLVGHALADYPLQGDFLARAKNHTAPIPGVPWYQALAAHSLIHGGFVYVITGSLWLGLFEVGLHACFDYGKCDGALSFNQDQALHALFKVYWAGAVATSWF